MRWPDERRDRRPRRTCPKGRAPGLHVLVLAEALPRRRHHRRDQTAPRMRGRATRRSRKERAPLLAILSRPALSSPNVAARIDQGAVQLLTRSGLDWTAKYPATAAALATLKVESAYLDGELCGVRA